ncbi:MAG: phosphoribosylaminoimidazolesuccinocarboxamide synthase [Patescibacteria group bacterium]|nr:phosphoribosylaminoimidazolesuccinocarboxamide synthase [Patescibacteria group bacterium]
MTVEEGNRPGFIKDAPAENFQEGILTVDLPQAFGLKTSGKVRDYWTVNGRRITVTTDRTSAFDKLICTVPLKGAVLNMTSQWWFSQTGEIIPNHLTAVPHPNVLISRQAQEVIPVEMVVRAFMAKSATSTSVYHNYENLGRRKIYGINFPDGLSANEEFPMGPIVTPTTKAKEGHDLELDEDGAAEIADRVGGKGTWDKMKMASLRLFGFGSKVFNNSGLILADTKYEFGIDEDGEIMLLDEVHTSDSSRIWRMISYLDRFREGENPETFDKEILRRWLAEHGFKGEGLVPVVDPSIIEQMTNAYTYPFYLTAGYMKIGSSSPEQIRERTVDYFERN